MDTLDPVKGQGVCIVVPGGYVFAAQDLVDGKQRASAGDCAVSVIATRTTTLEPASIRESLV